ncbi:hypothetical protein GCM10009808_20040 [Microbacterium sediminicola]|uniref:Flp pilus-assembly TadG-like N-terminal domain-containing protein n=1 Tax=Microbacterium sediminicola TaxID=415210 RepID=A0ABN2IBW3_9MICO
MLVTRLQVTLKRLRRRLAPSNDDGSILTPVLIVVMVLGLVTVTVSGVVVNTTRTTSAVRGSLQSQAAADAGMAAAIAAIKSVDACSATAPTGSVPASGADATYTTTVACDDTGSTITITSTGVDGDSSTTVEAVYGLVAQTEEVADPSLTPVGLVLYEGSTMGQVTLLASGDNEPQIVSISGTFGCRLTIPGNLISGGDIVSTDGCNVSGDIYSAGDIDFSGGDTSVQGDILAAGTGLSEINSAVGPTDASEPFSLIQTNGSVDLKWMGDTQMRADIIANGDVTVNDRTVEGTITLPTGLTPSINGGSVVGSVVNSDTIPELAAPSLPGWYDYAYDLDDWPGAAVVTLAASGTGPGTCRYFNRWPNQGWKDLANYTGTVVIDGRACDILTSNAGGNPSPEIKASNVVLLAEEFNTTALTMTSADGISPKVWFITEDTVDDAEPTCPLGDGDETSFTTNGANLDGVRSLIYTPCRISVAGGGIILGSLYTNGFNSGGQITIKGELMSLPGMPSPDGGFGNAGAVEVETGEYTLGALMSRRDT